MDNPLGLLNKLKNLAMTDWKYILIVLILVFIINGVVLGYYLTKREIAPAPAEGNEAVENILPEVTWNKYVNHNLGFSIEFPDNVYGGYRCSPRKTIQVLIKAFEDNENGIVYISQEYYYEAERNDKSGKRTGPCEKITYSLESLREKNENREFFLMEGTFRPFLNWALQIENVKNEDELDKFIKENYGSGCFARDKKSWGQDGVYDITIGGWDEWEDLGTTDCPVNYIYKILYAPEKNKLMAVNLGQDCNFFNYLDTEFYQCYDEEMINSFKFEF
ncbi:hypothetical protein KAU40_01860 [Candidatus Parcubacteria bacterium]|nr:hypothetical protein [Candidatus Parcubacteria bacterium]